MRLDLTRRALARSRLVLFVALAILVGGVLLYVHFPAQEEPDVPVNQAVITASLAATAPERLEGLLAKPIEAAARDVPEVDHIYTTLRSGFLFTRVELRQDVATAEMPRVWQRLRAKLALVAPTLPPGTEGPLLDDDFGRVAVASIAMTAPGYTSGEIGVEARKLRERLSTLDGGDRVTLHGLTSERVYVEFDTGRLVAAGITVQTIVDALRAQNAVQPGGHLVQGGAVVAVDPMAAFDSLDAIRRVTIALADGRLVRVGDVATVRRMPVDPPDTAALYNGREAAVLAVGMAPARNIAAFGRSLRAEIATLQGELPAGFTLHLVTFQPDVVAESTGEVQRTLYETLGIVMLVVVLFLGIRTGLVVGAIVPLTILATLVLMAAAGIAFHNVSLATIIIALGLLVDNGIVVAEDVERRLDAGEDARTAAIGAGDTLAVPLLVSSLTIVLAFLPLLLARSNTAEYARSMSEVMAMALLSSWALSITVTPLLCARFARPRHADDADEDRHYRESRFYGGYRRLLEAVLARHAMFALGMLGLLGIAAFEFGHVRFELTPNSTRPQYQITVELPPGVESGATVATLKTLSAWLDDRRANPDVVDHVAYAGDTGPRFILALNPPDPAPNRGYVVVNLKSGDPAALARAVARARAFAASRLPGARIEARPFSYGSTEAGLVLYRFVGPDRAVVSAAAERLRAAMAALPGSRDVKTDVEPGVVRTRVAIDEPAARRAGVSREDVARGLAQVLGDVPATVYREDDRQIPVVLRASAREAAGSPGGLMLFPSEPGRRPVPLAAIARIDDVAGPGALVRFDQQPAATLSGLVAGSTADQVVKRLEAQTTALRLPAGYRIVFGGEILESQQSNASLLGSLPFCFLLMLAVLVWQFDSIRKVAIIVATIPFCIIGVAAGLLVSGEPMSFMGLLGLLSLAGIIVNNAILLLERIEAERSDGKEPREAVLLASQKRLRPIIMTKLVCVLGLVPLYAFGGPLFRPLAVVIMGGLTLGSLITLGLVPVLYAWLFRVPTARAADSRP